jgi:Raf kinase inhibitor-like YbhB/YbcL family protein
MSFAIVVDDPDAPNKVWVHWVAWGLAPDLRALEEDVVADDDRFVQGTNDNGKQSWSPPCPPKADGAHRYVFHVFAADILPDLPTSTTRDQLYRALDHHVLAMGELTGHFDR